MTKIINGYIINIDSKYAVVSSIDWDKREMKFSKTFNSYLAAARFQHDSNKQQFAHLHIEHECPICIDDILQKLEDTPK